MSDATDVFALASDIAAGEDKVGLVHMFLLSAASFIRSPHNKLILAWCMTEIASSANNYLCNNTIFSVQ